MSTRHTRHKPGTRPGIYPDRYGRLSFNVGEILAVNGEEYSLYNRLRVEQIIERLVNEGRLPARVIILDSVIADGEGAGACL